MPPSAAVMVDELRTALARAGFELELIVNPASFSDHPDRSLEALVARTPASAWIAYGSREPMQRGFLKRQLPCLVAGSCAAGIALPSIDLDYRATCRHAGGLLRAKGHRNITLCLPEGATGGEADSEAGMREALENKADLDTRLSVIRHDGTAANLCSLLDRELRSDHRPTAILVARAVHVLTVVTHLQRRGIAIPGDGGAWGRGGMRTKVTAARLAARSATSTNWPRPTKSSSRNTQRYISSTKTTFPND
jgi:DNA-binding LacI/PurR family transcriptional regulator